MIKLIEKLVAVHGITGFEHNVAECIQSQLPSSVQCHLDNIGNLIVTLGSGNKTLLFAAHMDELGFIVTDITEQGMIRFKSLGGIDPRVMPGTILRIRTETGEIRGIIGVKPPHLMTDHHNEMNNVISFNDMVIDIGAGSYDEVKAMGVEILQPITFEKHFLILNDKYISCRGLDDRIGCAVMMQLIEKFSKQQLKTKIIFAFTVQEERGLRGASLVAAQHKADYAFALDTSTARVTDEHKHLSNAILGCGPAIRALDNRHISDINFVKKIKSLAEKKSIPVQTIFTGGTTDVAAIEVFGPKSVPLCFPVRYTHSPVEMVSIQDIEQMILLCETIIHEL